jgi:enoyl-CoA hydratase/carnithine racemase
MREVILNAVGKNALSSDLMQTIRDELRAAQGAPLLITGSGDAFSAGLNLKEVQSLNADSARAFLELLEKLFAELYLYPGPTVALVNGHAIAGGAVLTLACDHRVMKQGTGARIGLNETPLGLPFPPLILRLVRSRLARRHRERVILGGELFDAETALELGLVDEIATDASALAGERLAVLAAYPRAAYAYNKQALRREELSVSTEEREDYEQRALPLWSSDEIKAKVAQILGTSR